MKLLAFETYEAYVAAQIAANQLKFHHVFAEDPELRAIADYVRRHQPDARTGLCHGVRNGYEVHRLRTCIPDVDIRGTDIAPSIASVPHCLHWDMHELKPEWRGAVDVIYSNSWDHTYDPPLLFACWSDCLSPTGRAYLSYTAWHGEAWISRASGADVFGCSLDELVELACRSFRLETYFEVPSQLTLQTWRRRWTFLRQRDYWRALTARLTSRPVTVLVLRRRSD